MTKVMIVSDTHGRNENFMKAFLREAPIDMLIHCGDLEGGEYFFDNVAEIPVHMVSGNNDFFSSLPYEDEFEIEGYKVFLSHGHQYRVSMGPEWIKEEARERGADIVMYGHIHRPVLDEDGDIIALNPGSLSYPRQEGKQPTYLIMTIDDKGNLDFKFRFV